MGGSSVEVTIMINQSAVVLVFFSEKQMNNGVFNLNCAQKLNSR